MVGLLRPDRTARSGLASVNCNFFVPVFFLVANIGLGLHALLAGPRTLTLVPMLMIYFVVTGVAPVLIFQRHFGKQGTFTNNFLLIAAVALILPALRITHGLRTVATARSSTFILTTMVIYVVTPVIFGSICHLTPRSGLGRHIIFLNAGIFDIPITRRLSHG